jgi:RNA polymerase sigma factor (sigma-70 family)
VDERLEAVTTAAYPGRPARGALAELTERSDQRDDHVPGPALGAIVAQTIEPSGARKRLEHGIGSRQERIVLREGVWTVVLGARTGEGSEFVGLLDPHLAGAYRLAGYLLCDAAEAEDAIQEALEKAWLAWPKLRDQDRFGAWFDRIVANVCKDRLRKRRGASPVQLDDVGADSVHEADPFRAALARDQVGRLVRKLPPDQQLVVALRFWRDLSLDEVADRLDVPLGTVKSRLHYAMRTLRRELDRQPGEVKQ